MARSERGDVGAEVILRIVVPFILVAIVSPRGWGRSGQEKSEFSFTTPRMRQRVNASTIIPKQRPNQGPQSGCHGTAGKRRK